jgi:catalase
MYDGAAGDAPIYEPNSIEGIQVTPEAAPYPHAVTGVTGHHARNYQQDDFFQAGELYRLMSEEEKTRLVGNIVGSLEKVTRRDIQLRAICNFYRADADYGTRIAKGLIIDIEAEMASRGIGRGSAETSATAARSTEPVNTAKS